MDEIKYMRNSQKLIRKEWERNYELTQKKLDQICNIFSGSTRPPFDNDESMMSSRPSDLRGDSPLFTPSGEDSRIQFLMHDVTNP